MKKKSKKQRGNQKLKRPVKKRTGARRHRRGYSHGGGTALAVMGALMMGGYHAKAR